MKTLMTVSAAAAQLETTLRSHAWYHSIADGHSELGETIFLWVTSTRHTHLRDLDAGYLGYTVQIRALTQPRLVVHGDLVFVGVPDADENQPSRTPRFGEARRPWEARSNRAPSAQRRARPSNSRTVRSGISQ